MTLGDKFYMLLLGPVLLLLVSLLARLFKKCNKKCRRVHNYLSSQRNDLFWNGVIKFFDQSYFLLCFAISIGFSDSRLGSDYYWEEQLSSAIDIVLTIILFGYTFVVIRLYQVTIERDEPFPDPVMEMTPEELVQTYGHRNLVYIRKELYTETKHEEFMATYGILIAGMNLKKLGR